MKNYKKIITYAIIIIFVLYIICICPREMQNDTFWSIKVGEKMVREGARGIDDFSIHTGLYYIAHHFLTDVLIYIIYSFAGFTGLYTLEIVLALIMMGLLYILNKEICGRKMLSAALLFVQSFTLIGFIAVRAQMISFVLFIIELILLEKHRKNSKKRYVLGLSIIPILLANFHMGTVPFYFIILGVYIISLFKMKLPFVECANEIDTRRLKQLVLVFLIGTVTIFINPYFVDGVIYPFKTFGNKFINETISEFQPLNITSNGGWLFIYVALIVIMLIINNKKLQVKDCLLLFGTMFMAVVAIRYVSLFVICSSVILIYLESIDNLLNFNENELRAMKWTFVFVFSSITLVLFSRFMLEKDKQYVPTEMYPVQAVEFLKKEIDSSERVFNEYSWGSYLMLNDIKVYIDSRCDLYTKEYNGTDIADDYNKLMLCDKDYKEIIEKYNLNIFIIPIDTSLATLLEENKDFENIYMDETAVIYKRI